MAKYVLLFIYLVLASTVMAQMPKIGTDSTLKNSNLTFTGTRVFANDENFDPTGEIILSSYISSYYALYSDKNTPNQFHSFPTVSPKSNVFSVNLIQFGANYTSEKFRSHLTVHAGDIPASAWSSQYNMVQEANIGMRIAPKLWFDAGFFRTHIGLESIQPRENITMSLAMTTYFEPYFLSGAKLTYQFSDVWVLQLNAFNGFNTFIENNNNKAIGLSAVYAPNQHFTLTINTITSDESSIFSRKQQRLYNNIYAVYHSNKIDFGAEYNLGIQQNSQLNDSFKTALMMSALFALKYKITGKTAIYARAEYYSDKDEILTGPVFAPDEHLIGLHFKGITAGFEIKPIANSYVRCEGRWLQTGKNESIFNENGYVHHRYEAMAAIGVWF